MFNSSSLTWTVQVGSGPQERVSRNHGKTLMVHSVGLLQVKVLVLCKQSTCAERSQPPCLGALPPAQLPDCWPTTLKLSTSRPSTKAYGSGISMPADGTFPTCAPASQGLPCHLSWKVIQGWSFMTPKSHACPSIGMSPSPLPERGDMPFPSAWRFPFRLHCPGRLAQARARFELGPCLSLCLSSCLLGTL